MSRTHEWIGGFLLFALLGTTYALYWPGLSGPFVLDDIPNLKLLGIYGPVTDLPSFYRFVFSISTTYPVRPLAFASFLINDNAWPIHLPDHKNTNLLIHLVNGALVFWLSLLLSRLCAVSNRTVTYIAISTAALWLLAPLQVSTVLYLIQRMTQLSALFVLCGLITYCYARPYMNRRPFTSLAWMTFGVVFFGGIGFLSKQNAVLITLYVLVIELALLRYYLPITNPRTRTYMAIWKWAVLVVPTIAAFGAIIWNGTLSSYEHRQFSAFERIASQPRILFDYLQNLLLPVRQGTGVTHDDFVLSTGLLTPPSTILAIVALAGLVLVCVYLSKRLRLLSFACLWFVSGHLLESSFLPLEPYFEHRNYLPAFGPFFAISFFVCTTRLDIGRYLKAALLVYIILFAAITSQNVHIWSNKALMAETWAREHPASIRAHQLRADLWTKAGALDKAYRIMKDIAAQHPDSMGAQIQVLLTACRIPDQDITQTLSEVSGRVAHAHYDPAAKSALFLLAKLHHGSCPRLATEDLLRLVDTVLQTTSAQQRPDVVADLLYLKSVILSGQGQLQSAVAHLYRAFRQKPNYRLGVAAVRLLYKLGQYEQADKALRDVEQLSLPPWDPNNFRERELEQLRAEINKQLKTD